MSGTRAMGAQRMVRAPVGNAKLIADLMRERKIRGSFKDYVVLAGDRMTDYKGAYAIVGKVIEGVQLVHKRRLHEFVGEELAGNFWHRGCRHRRRT